jgi:hypothetical protein
MTLSKRGWEGMDLPHTAPKSRSLAALGMTRGERAIVTCYPFSPNAKTAACVPRDWQGMALPHGVRCARAK